MSDKGKKPGFLDGFMDALAKDDKPETSEQVLVALQAIDELELTSEERGELIGILTSEFIKTSLIRALGGDNA